MTTTAAPAAAGVDERVPLRRLVPLACQHVLAGVAAPVSSVVLVAATLRLPGGQTASLLSATLVLCGIGALLQSLGVRMLRAGARLPFLMLPGGAAVAIFLQIAQEYGPATASGSVLVAAVFLLCVLPFYGRLVRLFPPLVMGTAVVLIGINMIKVTAPMVAAGPGPGFATLGVVAALFLVLRGVWRQLAVLLGLVGGTLIAVLTGTGLEVAYGGAFALPDPFPYGAPHVDLLAAVPLLVFALASLAEATGQTVLNSETVGRTPDPGRDVPRIVRADALVSLGSGIFGTSLMVTSAENIGIVRLTGVRSRFVTAAAGLLLVVCGLLGPVSKVASAVRRLARTLAAPGADPSTSSTRVGTRHTESTHQTPPGPPSGRTKPLSTQALGPLTRVLAAVPQPVVGAAGLVIYAVIAVMGFGMLSRTDLDHGTDGIVVALALVAGLLPIVAPQMYAGLPPWARTLFGSGVAAGVIASVVLTAVFRVLGPREPAVTTPSGPGAPPAAGSR
ncbi:solute carrier family 23 protein [Streptomyces sp. NPDC050095]|uniref:uracil-xanthine permease family protein n=1 Tax=unclassified Streptomyces TaxID=2593676 RepID=UPI00343E8937